VGGGGGGDIDDYNDFCLFNGTIDLKTCV
jgi:hypothetical protein